MMERSINPKFNENYIQLCSNCCEPCNFEDETTIKDLSVPSMLSSLYNLNYLTQLSTTTTRTDSLNFDVDSLVLCSPCSLLLNHLHKLFTQFNELRKVESTLAQQIKTLDQLILSQLDISKSNPSISISPPISLRQDIFTPTTTTNVNSRSLFSYSPNDGPWVRIGPRLEEMELQNLGYAPSSQRHLYQQPPPQQQQKVVVDSSNTNRLSDDDDYLPSPPHYDDDFDPGQELGDEVEDVKLFSNPVDIEIGK